MWVQFQNEHPWQVLKGLGLVIQSNELEQNTGKQNFSARIKEGSS